MDSIQEAMEEVVFGNETFSTPIPYSIMYMPWEANEVLIIADKSNGVIGCIR